jgi:hypothetical protein
MRSRSIIPEVHNLTIPVGESKAVTFDGLAVSLYILNTAAGIAEVQLDDADAFRLASGAEVQFHKDDVHVQQVTVSAPGQVNFYSPNGPVEVLVIAGVTA